MQSGNARRCWSSGRTSKNNKNNCFWEEGIFCSLVSAKKAVGCFFRLLGVFLCFWGVFLCFWGCFLFLARSANFFGGGVRLLAHSPALSLPAPEGGGAVYLGFMSVLSQVFLVLSQAFLGFIPGFSPR